MPASFNFSITSSEVTYYATYTAYNGIRSYRN
jgi:hypothetical protein